MLRKVDGLTHVLALLAEMDLRNQQRFEAQGQAVVAALTSAEKAVQKAEIATEKRFESVNEFRQALNDQTKTFPSQIELEALSQRVDLIRDEMTAMKAEVRGASSVRSNLLLLGGLVVAVISAVMVVLTFALR